MAETKSHGDAALSEYYAPLPPPGKYVLIQYADEDGEFECNGISARACAADPHFIKRIDFEIVPDTLPTRTAPASDTIDTTAP